MRLVSHDAGPEAFALLERIKQAIAPAPREREPVSVTMAFYAVRQHARWVDHPDWMVDSIRWATRVVAVAIASRAPGAEAEARRLVADLERLARNPTACNR